MSARFVHYNEDCDLSIDFKSLLLKRRRDLSITMRTATSIVFDKVQVLGMGSARFVHYNEDCDPSQKKLKLLIQHVVGEICPLQ